jgi:3-hydroxyacyl-CoA dehydrogenase
LGQGGLDGSRALYCVVIDKIAIIGTGLVGRGWAIVFARAGCEVALYDTASGAAVKARELIADNVRDLVRHRLIDDADVVLERIAVAEDLAIALDGAVYAQESVFERVDVKRAAFEAIDRIVGPATIVGSSSSGIPASAFTEGLGCSARALVAHPINPPYLAGIVELVPAPWTSASTVATARKLMERVGQAPVELSREIEGFLLNRLQGVLLMEAWSLVEEGYATAADIDNTVKHGLGLRWSFMGPFETIDLNAPNGIADYARRLGPLYASIAGSRTEHRPWSEPLIAELERQRRVVLPAEKLGERSEWRDRRLMALAVHKREQDANDHTGGSDT